MRSLYAIWTHYDNLSRHIPKHSIITTIFFTSAYTLFILWNKELNTVVHTSCFNHRKLFLLVKSKACHYFHPIFWYAVLKRAVSTYSTAYIIACILFARNLFKYISLTHAYLHGCCPHSGVVLEWQQGGLPNRSETSFLITAEGWTCFARPKGRFRSRSWGTNIWSVAN
jgi:hypothetical protein